MKKILSIIMLLTLAFSLSTLCVSADQTYAYNGEFFYVDVDYVYVGSYGDKVTKDSPAYTGGLDGETSSKTFNCSIHYDGKEYSCVGSTAYMKLPPFKEGAKIIFDGIEAPEGYEIALNRTYSETLGKEVGGAFETPKYLYQIYIPVVRKGEKASISKRKEGWVLPGDVIVNIPKNGSKSFYDYTGKPIEPEPIVKLFNGTECDLLMKKGLDYKVSYKNNVNEGKASVVIEGLGIYTGTVTTEFSIYKPTVFPSSVKIQNAPSILAPGKTVKLNAVVKPDDASNKLVTWSSSNKKYATVSDTGVVKALKAGIGKTVIITATTKWPRVMGTKQYNKASVKIKIGGVTKVTATGPKKLKAGKSAKLKVTVTAPKGVSKAVSFKSSNKKYATVSSKGVVKAKKSGKGKVVVITVMAKDGSGKSAKVKIRIQ